MTERADVVIVGGGVIGSSIALHVRERLPAATVAVVERDPTYARASSRLATGGIRQQYGSPLNVMLARQSVAFYKTFDERLRAGGHPVRAWFRQRGYLFLADAESADVLDRRIDTLHRCGARVERWSAAQVRAHVPGLQCDDIVLGAFGPEDGYLDPREVLRGMRLLAEDAGARFIHGAVTGVERAGGRVGGVILTAADGREVRIATRTLVNAAGAYAAAVGDLAGVTLPVRPVRQHLFRLALDAPLPSRIPMIFDPDGTHWRLDDPIVPDGNERLVIGRSLDSEPAGENFECDERRLHGEMLPTLARRYAAARVRSVAESWAGLYEMTPDHNALLGEHPALPGFIVAAGFSGHGLMMAPATGHVVASVIATGTCTTCDATPLSPDRFDRGQLFHDGALI